MKLSFLIPRTALLVLAGLAIAGAVRATQVTFWRTSCPLDGAETRIFEKVSSDSMGGWDSDGCRYSTSGQWREYELSTCPQDLFTLKAEDFMGPFDDAVVARLKEEAARVRAEYPNPDALQIWDRYALAVRFYRILGRDDAFLADLYLRASWTARDAAVGVYTGLDGPEDAAKILEQGALELARQLSPAQRKTVLYNLARVAHRAGENALRDRYLDQFAARDDLDAAEQEALARFRKMSREIEPKFQDLALESWKTWLQRTDLVAGDVLEVTWLQADLLRRRDRPDEALALYRKVASDASAPPEVRKMASFFERRLTRP